MSKSIATAQRTQTANTLTRNFSERFHTATTVEKYCHDILSNHKLTFKDFDEEEIHASLMETTNKSSIQSIPNKVIQTVFESYTDSQAMIACLQKDAPKYAYPLIPALVKSMFYKQALSLFASEQICQQIEQLSPRSAKTFTTKYLCLDNLIATDFPKLSFTMASILNGFKNLKSIELHGITWDSHATPASRRAKQQPRKPIDELPAIVGLIMADYEAIKDEIRPLVKVKEYDADGIIQDTFASKHADFRTPGKVISTIRHAHTNYDTLYARASVRKYQYWMATGHSAVQTVIHEAIMENSSHELIRSTAQALIKKSDKKMLNVAENISKMKDPEQFILESYNSKIERYVKKEDNKKAYLSFASKQ